MHLSSLEVRWFWKGELETHPGWSKARDDVYLIVPSAEDLGIKWREGELQTKGRRAILGSMVFGDRLRGVVEQWTKWSHAGPDVDTSFKPLFSSGDTKTAITVWKHRALRKVRLDPFGYAQEVPGSEHIDRGVNYETHRFEG